MPIRLCGELNALHMEVLLSRRPFQMHGSNCPRYGPPVRLTHALASGERLGVPPVWPKAYAVRRHARSPMHRARVLGKGLELVVPDRFFVAGDMPAQVFLQKGLHLF
jgi:hypothetical protein